MNIAQALKFCQGSVSKKSFVPELTHFAIEKGMVRGFNGIMALCSPIPFDIDCTPNAGDLIKAINNCSDTVQMGMTPAGRLSIKSGPFKTLVDCIPESQAHVYPEGEFVEFDGQALLDGFKQVAQFIGNDADPHRSWTNGVLLKDQSLFATNNVIVVQYWVGATFPSVVNIPRAAVKEMIRINEAPVNAQINQGNSITFHYADGRWLRTQQLGTEWPNVQALLDKPSNLSPVVPGFFDAVETIKPFVDKMGVVYFANNAVRTHITDDTGAEYEVQGLHHEGKYNVDMLGLLQGVATHIDWTSYPAPCAFVGGRLRGVIVGMK